MTALQAARTRERYLVRTPGTGHPQKIPTNMNPALPPRVALPYGSLLQSFLAALENLEGGDVVLQGHLITRRHRRKEFRFSPVRVSPPGTLAWFPEPLPLNAAESSHGLNLTASAIALTFSRFSRLCETGSLARLFGGEGGTLTPSCFTLPGDPKAGRLLTPWHRPMPPTHLCGPKEPGRP
ncbi:hypothetical protein V1278_000239 [Bradyrhizobium sp. AZCC 1577]